MGHGNIVPMACKCITPRAYEVRISRPWWARALPFSRMYYCQHCQEKTLYLFDRGNAKPEHEYRARASSSGRSSQGSRH
jgi:hypothetical protein